MYALNLLKLVFGAGIGQFLALIVYPILIKFFNFQIEEFGYYSFYLSICNILAVVSSLGLHMSIGVSDSTKDSDRVLDVSVFVSLVFSLFIQVVLLCIFFFTYSKSLIFNLDFNNRMIIVMASPITIFFMSVFLSYHFYLNRLNKFNAISFGKFLKGIVFAGTSFALAFLTNSFLLLVISNFLSWAIPSSYYIYKSKKPSLKVTFKKILKVIVINKKFPIYYVPGQLLNKISTEVTSVLFTVLYGPHVSGIFFHVVNYLSTPISFFATNISDVFRQIIVRNAEQNQSSYKLFKLTTIKTLILSFLPFCLLSYFLGDIFKLILNESDLEITTKIGILVVPMLYFSFALSPYSSTIIHVTKKLEIDLIWQIVLAGFTTGSLLVGYYFFQSVYYSIAFYVIIYIIMYIINYILALKFASLTFNEKH